MLAFNQARTTTFQGYDLEVPIETLTTYKHRDDKLISRRDIHGTENVVHILRFFC